MGSIYTKQQLIDLYLEAKKKKGKPPAANDSCKLKIPCHQTYAKHFGSWIKFKSIMKDNSMYITKEQVTNQFKDFFEKEGYCPSIRETKKFGLYSDNTIRKVFGSYAKLIEIVGGKPRKFTKLDLSKELVQKDYNDLKEIFNRPPLYEEMEKFVKYDYYTALKVYFKMTFTEFLEFNGDLEAYKSYRQEIYKKFQ